MTQRWLALVTLLAACGTQEGAEKGDDTADACASASAPLTVDEASPAGFAAADILSWLQAGASAPLTWSDGADTTLTWTFAATGDVTWREVPDGCDEGDTLLIGVAYTVATADGLLDTSGTSAVSASTRDAATIVLNVTGSGVLATCGEPELEARFGPGSTTGHIVCEEPNDEEMATW